MPAGYGPGSPYGPGPTGGEAFGEFRARTAKLGFSNSITPGSEHLVWDPTTQRWTQPQTNAPSRPARTAAELERARLEGRLGSIVGHAEAAKWGNRPVVGDTQALIRAFGASDILGGGGGVGSPTSSPLGSSASPVAGLQAVAPGGGGGGGGLGAFNYASGGSGLYTPTASAEGADQTALSGPTVLRQGIGRRMPPDLAQVLQGLRQY